MSSEIVLKVAPDVSHRSVAIAYVNATVTWNRSLGHTMTAADDQIVIAQVKRFDRRREKRQVIPVRGADERNGLEIRWDDAMRLDFVRYGTPYMHEGVNRRFRIQIAQRFEYLFTSAHSGEPIVHQSNLHDSLR